MQYAEHVHHAGLLGGQWARWQWLDSCKQLLQGSEAAAAVGRAEHAEHVILVAVAGEAHDTMQMLRVPGRARSAHAYGMDSTRMEAL